MIEEPIPLTDEQRAAQQREAEQILTKLTNYGIALTAACTGLAFLAWQMGYGSAGFTKGIAVGALLSVVNLRILGRAIWGFLVGDRSSSMMALLFSLLLILAITAVVALRAPSWALGYGLGMAMPIPVGIWFALKLPHDDD